MKNRRSVPVIGLLAFLIVVPAILYEFIGAPHIPRIDLRSLKETLSGPFLSADAVIHGLGLLTWILWFYLLLVILLRAVAIVALQRGSPSGHRLLALTSVLAPGLILRIVDVAIGAVLLVGPVAHGKVVVSALPATSLPRVSTQVDAAVSDEVVPRTAQRSYVVRPGDSLWRIAERELGDGARWSEIFELNRNRHFPDGRTFVKPWLIRPNWVLWLPTRDLAVVAPTNGAVVPAQTAAGPIAGLVSVSQTSIPSLPKETTSPVHESASQVRRIESEPIVRLPSGVALGASFGSGILFAYGIAALRRRRTYSPDMGETVELQPESSLALDLRRAHVTASPGRMASAARELIDYWKAKTGTIPRLYAATDESDRIAFLLDESDYPESSTRIVFSKMEMCVRAVVRMPFVPASDMPGAIEEGVLVPVGTAGRTVAHVGVLGAGVVALMGEEARRFSIQAIASSAAGRHPADLQLYLLGDESFFGPCLRLPHVKRRVGFEEAESLLQEVQVEMMARARALAESGSADIHQYVSAEDSNPIPGLILVSTQPPDALEGLLDGVGTQCARYGCALLSVGWEPSSARLVVRADAKTIRIETELPFSKELRALLLDDETVEEAVRILCEAFVEEGDGTTHGSKGPSPDGESFEALPPVDVTSVPGAKDGDVEGPSSAEGRERSSARISAALRDMESEPVQDAAAVHCLGPLVVTRRGRAIRKGWQSRSKELLAYLIAHRDGASKEELIRLFWPEVKDRERALKLLRIAIFRLRDLFLDKSEKWSERYVVRTDNLVKLDAGRWDVDAWRFESIIVATKAIDPQEAIPLLREAVALHKGYFCDDCDFPWLAGVRERYVQMLIDGSLRLSQYLEEGGEFEEAIRLLDGALEFEPISETLHRRLIALEAEAGRIDQAEKRYQRLVAILAEELGEEPDPETLDLMRLVRKQTRSRV